MYWYKWCNSNKTSKIDLKNIVQVNFFTPGLPSTDLADGQPMSFFTQDIRRLICGSSCVIMANERKEILYLRDTLSTRVRNPGNHTVFVTCINGTCLNWLPV